MRRDFLIIGLLLTLFLSTTTLQAGDLLLSNNSGESSSTFFIEGEPTLVMNGFDLTPLGLNYPITIDAITIQVETPVPSEAVQVVIYEDGNGGSPQDAVLVSQTQVSILSPGIARIVLPEPVVTNAPVVWAGFYLPVSFGFLADDSGSSVLTYWGWRPGGTFNLANLNEATVFGPSNGTEPVNIDLGGVARINIEVFEAELPDDPVVADEIPPTPPIGRQIILEREFDTSILQQYPYCGEALFYDPQDITISADNAFELYCRADIGPFSPGVVRNIGQAPATVTSFERKEILYDIFAGGDYKYAPDNSEKLVVPVTHCLRPNQADLDVSVIGIAYGAPREWEILPTIRVGELICAEVTHTGFISYFTARTDSAETLNANLYFSGEPTVGDEGESRRCGTAISVRYAIRNEGFVATPPTTIRVRDVSVRTGRTLKTVDYPIDSIPPGETRDYHIQGFVLPTTFYDEMHRMVFTIDPENQLNELNNSDNQTETRYMLLSGTQC